VAGYPLNNGKSYLDLDGKIFDIAPHKDKYGTLPRAYYFNNLNTSTGMSGGPLVNQQGNIVGILIGEKSDSGTGAKTASVVMPIQFYPQWQAIRSSQRLSSQSTPKPITYPVNPYQDSQCSSQLDPYHMLRYQPQKPINIAYQADKKYVEVDSNRLMNRSFMKQYDKKLVSVKASFGMVLKDFWIYDIFNQVSQTERSRYFLATINSLRIDSFSGVLIDKEKFDDILKIRGNSIVKIEGYATVRDAISRYGNRVENQEKLLIEAHQIQVICQFN
jgi:hypothetical protein